MHCLPHCLQIMGKNIKEIIIFETFLGKNDETLDNFWRALSLFPARPRARGGVSIWTWMDMEKLSHLNVRESEYHLHERVHCSLMGHEARGG